MLAIWSLAPLPFLKPAWTSEFTVHVLLKPGLENFEHYFTSIWYECNCAVVWTFLGIAFLWDWNKNWCFLVLWPLLSWFLCVPGFMLMLFVLSCKTWSVVKLGLGWPVPLQGLNNLKILLPSYLWHYKFCTHRRQLLSHLQWLPVIYSQGSVQAD